MYKIPINVLDVFCSYYNEILGINRSSIKET